MIVHCPACGAAFDVTPTVASAAWGQFGQRYLTITFDLVSVEHNCRKEEPTR